MYFQNPQTGKQMHVENLAKAVVAAAAQKGVSFIFKRKTSVLSNFLYLEEKGLMFGYKAKDEKILCLMVEVEGLLSRSPHYFYSAHNGHRVATHKEKTAREHLAVLNVLRDKFIVSERLPMV